MPAVGNLADLVRRAAAGRGDHPALLHLPPGAQEPVRVTWAELQGHAAFEAARTTRRPETIETPLGVLECLHYQRTEADGSMKPFRQDVLDRGYELVDSRPIHQSDELRELIDLHDTFHLFRRMKTGA